MYIIITNIINFKFFTVQINFFNNRQLLVSTCNIKDLLIGIVSMAT